MGILDIPPLSKKQVVLNSHYPFLRLDGISRRFGYYSTVTHPTHESEPDTNGFRVESFVNPQKMRSVTFYIPRPECCAYCQSTYPCVGFREFLSWGDFLFCSDDCMEAYQQEVA